MDENAKKSSSSESSIDKNSKKASPSTTSLEEHSNMVSPSRITLIDHLRKIFPSKSNMTLNKPRPSTTSIAKRKGLFKRSIIPTLTKLNQEMMRKRFFDAVVTRNIPEVRQMLKRGLDPNFHSIHYGMTPLHQTAERDDCELGLILLKSGKIDLELKGNHGNTALHYACYTNCENFVGLLLEHGADANTTDHCGKTALHLAVEVDHYGIALKLLQNGANVNVLDNFDNTPLSLSIVENNNIAISKLLFKFGADMSLEYRRNLHIFFEAVVHCHTLAGIDSVLLLLENGVEINMIEEYSGRNCLHFVAIGGYSQLATVLVEKGANVNTLDHLCRTPAKTAKWHQNLLLASYFKKLEGMVEASVERFPTVRWMESRTGSSSRSNF